ncbi:PREDICTED: uncharacterized protein LOC105462792 [Wasmannia auropunctata]|uniref:uncharacterized protein LOC105462792 n=1 Tax=Wasmannia auropunctata TaxID=64793 RepID=UPI0005EE95D8|nr:PREDICTED: uncharacterized protein LOC105462792 [Wasmannia auropunctata]
MSVDPHNPDMSNRGKRGALGKKPNPNSANMDSKVKGKSPSGTRTPEERREEGPCPYPPASTSCEGSEVGGTTTPSLKAAIVKIERVNIHVPGLTDKPRSTSGGTLPSADVSMEVAEEGHFEKPADRSTGSRKKIVASAKPNSPDLEYVDTMEAGPSSRPSTPQDQDLEFVSYTSASRPRRNSGSSRASTKKRRIISSPDDSDDDKQPPGRFTDVQRQEVEGLLDQVEELSSADMAALANEWLETVEDRRQRSKNIKGSFAHAMKVKVAATAGVVKILATRAAMDGDSGFMRAKILSLQQEMKELREENQRLRLEMDDLRSGAPIFGNAATRDDRLEAVKSPGPSAEYYSPMAVTPQIIEDRPVLTAAVSSAVAGALREHLPEARKGGPRQEKGPRRLFERTGRLEGHPHSSAVTESQTEENGFTQAKSTRKRTKKRGSRTGKEEAPRIPAEQGGNRADVGDGTAEFPPLPVEGRTVKPAPAQRVVPMAERRRPPRSAAVSMSFPENMKFADVVKKARDSVNLGDLGIEHTRLRATMSGAVLVEIPGNDMSPKADTLAAKLQEVFMDSGVRVSRPSLKGELRLSGLDASISPRELRAAMAEAGGCAADDIRMGHTRATRNGLRTVWTQCPLNAAIRLAQAGSLRVGWSTTRVDLLKRRPAQCYRCFATGHVRERCPSEVDRASCCFNCGADGHLAKDCGRPASCPICKEAGRRLIGAQDLLMQVMHERGCGLACIQEPYIVPTDPRWAGSSEDPPLAAITWQGPLAAGPVTVLGRGPGFVAVRWEGIVIASCYFSPNKGIREFKAYLQMVTDTVSQYSRGPLIIMGDFNARSHLWEDTHPTSRGDALVTWAAALDLRLINEGTAPTCVRPQGTSIVDLTWASSAILPMIVSWVTAVEAESLSDHRYIFLALGRNPGTARENPKGGFPKWNIKSLRTDLLLASLIINFWSGSAGDGGASEQAKRIQNALTEASDLAMTRSRSAKKKSVYWWSDDIAAMRKECIHLRRRITRARKKNRAADPLLERELAQARKRLRIAIKEAKNGAWREFISTIDRDPWGRPYRIVTGRLRSLEKPVCEALAPRDVFRIISGLFPKMEAELVPRPRELVMWEEDLEVTDEEILWAAGKMKHSGKAPGPDGIIGGVIREALPELVGPLMRCFTACLREGVFPACWKRARLVLLKKPGKAEGVPSSYRPICLLNELGKMMERIIVRRIRKCIREGTGLSDDQFGFREQRSTSDAILRLRSLLDSVYGEERQHAIAVSLDVTNAFNSLPWKGIRQALVKKEVLNYLRAISGDYLANRWISWVDAKGRISESSMTCGVPQGSAYGPESWNLAYDEVLDTDIPSGCHIICYADDTLVVALGDNLDVATARVEMAVALVMRRIESLGLKVSPAKTEAGAFSKAHRFVQNRSVLVGGVLVPLNSFLKYLGLTIGRRWTFREHFAEILPRAERMSLALARLMPNLRGPNEWALNLDKKIARDIRALQRRVAIRVIAAYRTLSYPAAFLLARVMPVEYLAGRLAKVFLDTRDLQREEIPITHRVHERIRENALEEALTRWEADYRRPGTTAVAVREAVAPVLDRWFRRTHGQLTFRMTQIITGHGCFNLFLHRIGKAPSSFCSFCEEGEDTNMHTLGYCTAWVPDREALTAVIGPELDLRSVIFSILQTPARWAAFKEFCEVVMLRKEEAERARQAQAAAEEALLVRVDNLRESDEED